MNSSPAAGLGWAKAFAKVGRDLSARAAARWSWQRGPSPEPPRAQLVWAPPGPERTHCRSLNSLTCFDLLCDARRTGSRLEARKQMSRITIPRLMDPCSQPVSSPTAGLGGLTPPCRVVATLQQGVTGSATHSNRILTPHMRSLPLVASPAVCSRFCCRRYGCGPGSPSSKGRARVPRRVRTPVAISARRRSLESAKRSPDAAETSRLPGFV